MGCGTVKLNIAAYQSFDILALLISPLSSASDLVSNTLPVLGCLHSGGWGGWGREQQQQIWTNKWKQLPPGSVHLRVAKQGGGHPSASVRWRTP